MLYYVKYISIECMYILIGAYEPCIMITLKNHYSLETILLGWYYLLLKQIR